MFGVARLGQDTAAGVQLGAGQAFVTVEGSLWIVLGDVNAGHGLPPHMPGGDNMSQGSSFVSINGIPVCRAGHLASCGHPTSGSSFKFISD